MRWFRQVRDERQRNGHDAGTTRRLFEPFTQVHADRRLGGAALGLAITRRLCELLGGTVSVASEAGAGSTFTLIFPAETEPAATAGSG